LSAVVGGLGLMGTMSMNVIERTREIGVMRALGASDLDVLKLVITEGMMIGILSWALGTLVGLPITYFFDVVIGYAFVRAPMPFVFSVWGCGVWGVVDLRGDHRRYRQCPARVERFALDRARCVGV